MVWRVKEGKGGLREKAPFKGSRESIRQVWRDFKDGKKIGKKRKKNRAKDGGKNTKLQGKKTEKRDFWGDRKRAAILVL